MRALSECRRLTKKTKVVNPNLIESCAMDLLAPDDVDKGLFDFLGQGGDVLSGDESECENSENTPALLSMIRSQLDTLTTPEIATLAANLSKLHSMKNVPYASGCSGTGMDDHVTDLFAEASQRRYGISTQWKSLFAVERNEKKRVWLNHFTSCVSLFSDVTELYSSSGIDTRTGDVIPLPTFVFKYSFGFSCKDFSTLNNSWNSAKDEQSDLLKAEQGSTGITFAANMSFVEKTLPPVVLMENVRLVLKGKNWLFLKSRLEALGYEVIGVCLDAAHYGHIASRNRAWIVAVLACALSTPFNSARFKGLAGHEDSGPPPLSIHP